MWVWVGVIVLFCVVGMVNVVGFFGFEYQVVSYMIGIISQFGMVLVQGDWCVVGYLWGLFIVFCLGVMFSGMIVQDSVLQFGCCYGVVLMLELLLLLIVILLFKQQQIWGVFVVVMVCGLQNVMVMIFSGVVVCIIYFSGMFIDFGIGLGYLLCGLLLLICCLIFSGLIVSGFFVGGIFGVWLFLWVGYDVLFVLVLLIGGIGLGYVLYV